MEGAAGGSPLSMLLPFVLIFGVFYFIVIMPAKKQQKKKEAMIAGLKKGDRIVTNGGIHGTVATVDDTSLLVNLVNLLIVKCESEINAMALFDVSQANGVES